LGLNDVEIAPIEAKVTTQIETYHQKLRQYEEAFASATQRKHQPGEANRTQLRQTWQTLGLNEADVKAIEAPILVQVETYQANLRDYEQSFADATEQEYPLSQAKRSELRQRQQALSLSNEDIEPIENRITALIEDHLKKLQQYEQVFLDSIQFEFPVNEVTREELQRFQQLLELGDEEIRQIEEKVASQNEYSKSQTQRADVFQTPEVNAQETHNLEVLQEYEIEVAKYINYGISLEDYVARKKLDSLRDTLGISHYEAKAVESRLTGNAQPPNTRQASNTSALQEYEIEVAKWINVGISPKDYTIRKKLDSLRNTLRISRHEAEAVEVRLSENNQVNKSPVNAASPPPVQPKYRRGSVASKIRQANPAKTPDNPQPDLNNPPLQFLEAVNSPSEVGAKTQQRFWLMWTLAYTFGNGFGWFASNLLFSNLDHNTFLNLIKGSIVGFALGGAQWLLLRHISHRMKLWILLTTVSYAASYAMATTFWSKLYGSMPLFLIESLYGLVTGSLIGLAQWFVLQPLVQQSRIWFLSVLMAEILGGAIGWGIFGGDIGLVIFGDTSRISSLSGFLVPSQTLKFALIGLTSGGVSGVLSGLITGRVMLRLLRLKKSLPIA